MFQVLNCLATEHDLRLVGLAGAVCLLASFAAVSLFHRALATQGGVRARWLAGAGIATGCGIWATHFIAMLAYAPTVPVGYDLQLTFLSFLAAVAITTAGLALASAALPGRTAAGGAIVGAGVAAMHYTGMAALQVPGRIAWSADLIVASVILGAVLGVLALTIATRDRAPRTTLLAALVLTLAIVSHHFTAMGAVKLVFDPARTIDALAIPEPMLALTIGGVTLAVLSACIIAAVMDRRLSEKNTLLDTALNNMNHGLIMFDANARVILCNQRYLALYGLEPGAVVPGTSLREIVDRRAAAGAFNLDPEQYCRSVMDDIARGATFRAEIQLGNGRVIAAVSEPMPGGGWIATHREITEERQREESFRFLFDSNPLPMWVWDHATLGYLAVNNAALAQYGYTREQFLQLTMRDTKRNTDWNAVDAVSRGDPSILRKGLVSQHARADGSLFDIELYGRPMQYEGRAASLVAGIDITDRKRAEGELRQAREFLNTVLESVPLPIVVKSAADLTYVFANRAAEELFGVSREVAIGKTVLELLPRAEADITHARDQEMLAADGNLFVEAKPTSTPKGTRFMSSLRVPIRDENGKARYILGVMEDVTERKQKDDELHRTRAFLDTVIENMPAMLTVKDARDLRYVLVNRAAEAFFGMSSEEMVGKKGSELFSGASTGLVEERDREVVRTGELRAVEESPFDTPRNGTRLLTSKKMLVRGKDGEAQYVLSLGEDVTDRKRARDKIAHMARHDTLTDLPNRATFNERLAAVLESAAPSGRMFAVLSLDLDRFKEANDVFGHAAGDALLCEAARRLGDAAEGAFLARLGGDEFALIVAEGAQPATAEALAARLMASMAPDMTVGAHSLQIGLSIGIAVYPSDGKDATALLANANAALYRAKEAGRGTIRFFEAHMDAHLRDRRALQHDLRSAIENRELALHYQPQARIGGEIIGFEALVRWHHPSRGVISPGTFIPLAEESGLIMQLGEWALREACREAASWPKPLQIAVNLSPVQFRDGDLPATVHEILLETGLPPARLELEITEGVLISDFARGVSILRRLKLLGVRIAMDDFGTGYSSLSYLQSFPFDKIKIDRTFIANLTDNHYSATIVRAVIGLGRGLDLPVMAEGVETAAQLAFLARESCEEVQGYFIGRPAPIATYADMVGRKSAPRLKVVSG
jgi:diguanylate cyclase (GGDEF)-like protein/PAS domain S-box-containing protein